MQPISTTPLDNGAREFKLANYDAFGFDLDHTLAKYHIKNLFRECYTAMSAYLIKKKNYPADAFVFKNNICARGLVLDLKLGNFLKVSQSGRILRVSHGTRMLSQSEMIREYGEILHWQHYQELIDTVNNIGERYRIFDNLFDMPTAIVCAHCIDSLDKQAGGKATSYDIWPDIYDAINHAYHPKQFAADKGGFFPKFKQDTGNLVVKCSDEMKSFLKRLKEGHRKLFLLTSSYVDFATASLEFILGDDWQTYFDVNIAWARKPSFFTTDRGFTKLGDNGQEVAVDSLTSSDFHLTGNCQALTAYLVELTGKEKPKVLFFGDSMRSDVFPGKKFAGWDTVLILEEMECDQAGSDVCGVSTDQTENQDNCGEERSDLKSGHRQGNDSYEPSVKRTKLRNGKEENSLSRFKLDHEAADDGNFLSPADWGSLFDCNEGHLGTGSKEKTLWAHIIYKYSDVVLPRLDVLTDVSLTQDLRRLTTDDNSSTPLFYPLSPNIKSSSVAS